MKNGEANLLEKYGNFPGEMRILFRKCRSISNDMKNVILSIHSPGG
jgi:hypothetical protein